MKVREKTSNQIFTVYGIYWCGGKTFFYCFPRNTFGLSSYGEDEVDVLDSAIETDFVYLRTNEQTFGVFNRHLLEGQLLDLLLEHDPEAYKQFSCVIGKEP